MQSAPRSPKEMATASSSSRRRSLPSVARRRSAGWRSPTASAQADADCMISRASPIARVPGAASVSPMAFTERFECADDGTRTPAPTPQLFSFNNPRGACVTCNGFGATLEYDESLIVPYPDRSLRDGAIHPWTMPRYDNKRRALAEFAKRERIPMDVPWNELPSDARDRLLNARGRGYKGIFPFLRELEEKRYKQYIRVFLRQYQSARECHACHGAKLQPEALHVRVSGRTIAEIAELPVDRLSDWLRALQLSAHDATIAEHILKEAR